MQVFKELQRQLHPDKNPQEQEACFSRTDLLNLQVAFGLLNCVRGRDAAGCKIGVPEAHGEPLGFPKSSRIHIWNIQFA